MRHVFSESTSHAATTISGEWGDQEATWHAALDGASIKAFNVISGAMAAPVSSEQAWCPQVVQPSFVSSVVPGRQLAGGTAFRIYQYDT